MGREREKRGCMPTLKKFVYVSFWDEQAAREFASLFQQQLPNAHKQGGHAFRIFFSAFTAYFWPDSRRRCPLNSSPHLRFRLR